ncbi:unnamed protein product [Chironomus riparius]|uniref:GPI ethanolamine phosphate transferase 2 C-terminal domain-containing protein n=1 Tax=Chironomus riparius TaxID=315576 RepID=A0A9N9X1L6_9DIPT|nr:unnamed protein product [Chironomus riparius]
MNLKSENFYFILLITSVISSFIFCIGFFPYSVIQNSSNLSDSEIEKLNLPKINRSVLMIIDALRLDLIIDKNNFPFVHELLQKNEACMLQMKVNLPTVTKPRITALTSGTVPSFLDVARNLGKSKIYLDTFLHQIHMKFQNIVFSGDSAWFMFPDKFFKRTYANFDSFFVNDFYEGDKNITKSLAFELKQNDWRLLILHYLGLDHIGHVFNPYHELVPEKLKEMDQVVKVLHTKVAEWNDKSKDKSVIFLTSDHGMRNAGGHSGNSFQETHIPFLMIGVNCSSNSEIFYNQIDFATSFSIMSGLPIPKSSIGALIPEMMLDMDEDKKLDVIKIVNQRLLNMIKFDKSEEFYLKQQKAMSLHKIYSEDHNNKNAYQQASKLFMESSKDISERLAQQSLEVNLFYVLLGLFINILISIALIIPSDISKVRDLKVATMKFIPIILVGCGLKMCIFNEIFNLKNDFSSFFVIILMSVIVRIVGDILLLKIDKYKLHLFDNDILYLLLIGHFFFTISVGSSSFIEEEHQIWYYFCNAMFIILTFYEFRGRKSFETFFTVIIQCFPILIMHIFIRRMNQTGDKWINVQDIGDWLHQKENEELLHITIIISLAMTAVWLIYVHVKDKVLVPFVGLGCLFLYFHHSRSMINERIDLSTTTIFWINIIFIIFITILFKLTGKSKSFNFFVIFVLISLLLHQPQNLVMCFALGVSSMLTNHACNRMIKSSHEKIVAKIIMHWWLGKLFYFYQGNSNSLATVDTNAGFVGQTHVNMTIVFIFSTINTFNGQIIALMLLIISLVEDSKRLMIDSKTLMLQLSKWLSFLTIIPTTVFLVIITLLRHHLFIWSVFSPKLLYDFCTNVLLLIILVIVRSVVKFEGGNIL